MPELKTPAPNLSVPTRSKSAPLKKHLIAEVASGRLKPGARLSTESQFADEFDISRPTVRRALAELEGEGLIRREQGRGTFVNVETEIRSRTTTGTFAMVIAGADDLGGSAMIRGFEQGCRASHRNMFLCDSENNVDLQGGLLLRLANLDIAGVAFMPAVSPPTPDYQVKLLHGQNIPVVLCHRGVEGIEAPVLSVSHVEEGRLVGQAFAEKGHRRVAIVVAYQAGRLREKWVKGVREGLRESGGELPDEFVSMSPTTSFDYAKQESHLSKTLDEMLGSNDPPTAIFVVPDDFAYSANCLLQEVGLRVPEDISLIGLGDVNRSGAFTRRLTSVGIDGAKMGKEAVRLLDEIVSGQRNIHDVEQCEMTISLSDGQTLGPAPRRSKT